MIESKKSISVILPNYNGRQLLEQFVPYAFEALRYVGVDYEFIIVDDCSSDDSVSFVKTHFPEIKLFTNEKNSGFSASCNVGIYAATKDLVFLLNSDVQLTPDYFEKQFRYFDDVQTFGVMGRIMNFDGQKIEDTARLPYYKGGKFKANKFFYQPMAEYTLTAYLSGANALIDRSKLLFLEGFDTIYSPFYFEDFDLGLRAGKMGWNLHYEHESVCFHQISSSTNKIKKKGNFVKVIYNRNSFILQSIHLSRSRHLFWHIQLFTLTLIGHLLKGDIWILKSLSAFWKHRNEIKRSKQKIKQLQQSLSVTHDLDFIIEKINSSLKSSETKWL